MLYFFCDAYMLHTGCVVDPIMPQCSHWRGWSTGIAHHACMSQTHWVLCNWLFTQVSSFFSLPCWLTQSSLPSAFLLHHFRCLSSPWSNLRLYAFPPFILLGRIIRKIWQENVEEVVVITPVPVWDRESVMVSTVHVVVEFSWSLDHPPGNASTPQQPTGKTSSSDSPRPL